jgi:hypothetical protein
VDVIRSTCRSPVTDDDTGQPFMRDLVNRIRSLLGIDPASVALI